MNVNWYTCTCNMEMLKLHRLLISGGKVVQERKRTREVSLFVAKIK